MKKKKQRDEKSVLKQFHKWIKALRKKTSE